jgi:hypothetical protein
MSTPVVSSPVVSAPVVSALISSENIANPAVARCREAYDLRMRVVLATGEGGSQARCEAAEAFRQALPLLDSAQNIRDFIACVAYGMVLKVFFCKDATQLLYAAQIAQRSVRLEAAPPKSKTAA